MNTPFPRGPHAEKAYTPVDGKNYADRPGLPAKVVRPALRLNAGPGGCPAHSTPVYFWKTDFGISAWIPLTPSTAWVTTRSIVALINM